jgi:hypothetical protein
MGRALHVRLKAAQDTWKASEDDAALVEEVVLLAEHFGKQKAADGTVKRLSREELELICFEYVTA